MNKTFIHIILILILQFFSLTFAIDDIKLEENTSEITVPKTASITFDEVFKKAINHSYDITIADFDVLISKTGITSARSEYFPKLSLYMGTEYTHNYSSGMNIVTTVGEMFINPYTRYQSVMGITLSYNVFDFGVRRGRLDLAKEDVELKKMQEMEAVRELELNIIDIYTKILVAKRQLDLEKEILDLNSKNLELSKRLYKAKVISKTDLNDAEFKVSQTQSQIADLKKILAENLVWLGFYTQDKYDPENIKIAEIDKVKFNPSDNVDYTKSLTWKIYESEIKKKELELKITKRQNFPKVNAYGRYYMYGSDYSSYPDAWDDFGPSSYSIGIGATVPVFDGLVNYADIKKAKLELQQMYVKRDKAVAEWTTRLSVLRSNVIYLDEQLNQNLSSIKELTEKEKSKQKLLSKKVIMPIELNQAKVELLETQIEKQKNSITLNSITRAIDALTRY